MTRQRKGPEERMGRLGTPAPGVSIRKKAAPKRENGYGKNRHGHQRKRRPWACEEIISKKRTKKPGTWISTYEIWVPTKKVGVVHPKGGQ